MKRYKFDLSKMTAADMVLVLTAAGEAQDTGDVSATRIAELLEIAGQCADGWSLDTEPMDAAPVILDDFCKLIAEMRFT